jgi:DNA polymerase III sliding clamp (beta) subunit (PCNA family)
LGRPVLAGIHAEVNGDRLTLAAADGFRLSTAYATLDASAETDTSAILERAGLLAFAKSLKPKDAPVATINTAADTWTFSANGTRAAVRLIYG